MLLYYPQVNHLWGHVEKDLIIDIDLNPLCCQGLLLFPSQFLLLFVITQMYNALVAQVLACKQCQGRDAHRSLARFVGVYAELLCGEDLVDLAFGHVPCEVHV